MAADALWRARAIRLALGLAVLIAFAVLQYGLTEPGSPRAIALTDLSWTAAALLALQQTLQTGLRAVGRPRFGWFTLVAALACWLLGCLQRDYVELVLRQPAPVPDWVDLGALLFPPLAIVSMVGAIRRADLQSNLLRPLCNLGLISVALYTSLGIVLHDDIARTDLPPLLLATALAYPFLYGTALIFALIALAIYSDGARRPAASLMTLALAALTVGAINRGIHIFAGTPAAGGLLDLSWLIGFGLVSWVAWDRRAQPTQPAHRPSSAESHSLLFEPALPMLSLFTMFAAVAFDRDGLQRGQGLHIRVPGGLLFAALRAGA